MSVVTYIALISGFSLIAVSTIFRIEKSRSETLLLKNIRHKADRMIEENAESFLGVKKVLGASSFRLFLHYLLHQFLSFVLYIVKFVENHLYRLRNKNKVVAKDIRAQATENHLSHIARHKEAVALSEDEQEKLKHRSLND